MFKVNVDTKPIADSLGTAVNNLDKAVESGLNQIALKLQQEIISSPDVKNRGSDGIMNNINIIPNGSFETTVLANKDYAYYLENGNGPGDIYPKTAKALHFKINGKDIFVKKVKSYAGKHFMEKALNKVQPIMDQLMQEAVLGLFK